MKSNKIKDTIGRLKERFMKFVYTEEALQEMDKEKQLPEAERKELIKTRRKQLIVPTIIIVIVLAAMICAGMVLDRNETKEENNTIQETATELPEGERASITTGELTKYMIDSLNGIYLKIAYAEIDGKVAYSVTYNNDVMPKGEVVYTHYLTNEKVTTILLNGYPYLSYQEMGLQSEEEAYLATQLAVYEMISRQNISNISNGAFSLEKIKASEEQYEEMVDRLLVKANELVEYAIENTYAENNQASFDTKSLDIVDNGNETLIGPFYTRITPDENLARYLDDSYRFMTDFKVTSFYEDSKMYTCDKDGNEINQVITNEPFYVKVIGNERYFGQLNVSVTSKILYTKIYSGGNKEKKYAVLSDKNSISKTVTALLDNVDTGDVKLTFKNSEGEILRDIKYKLYDESGKVLQDNDGYSGWNEFRLPLGKYYVEIYDVPDEYFLNSNRYDIDLVEKDKLIQIDIDIDSIEEFLNN